MKQSSLKAIIFPAALMTALAAWPALSGCGSGSGSDGFDAGDVLDADAREETETHADPDAVPEDGGEQDQDVAEETGPQPDPWTITPLGLSAATQDMVSDAAGTLHLTWVDARTVHYGQVQGGSVIGEQTVSSTDVTILFTRPRMAASLDGSAVHVVWVGPDGLNPVNVYHAWREGGGAWQEEVALHEEGYFFAQPSIIAGQDGTLHIVTQKWTMETGPVAYSRMPDGGSWSPTILLSPTSEHRDVAMFIDAAGGIHTVYSGLTGAFYRHAPPGTLVSDSEAQTIPTAADVSGNYFGDVFVDGGGTVHHAMATCLAPCRDPYAGSIDYTSKPPAGEFAVPVRASDGALDSDADSWPAVGADGEGRVYVMWGEHHGDGTSACKLSILEGHGWSRYTMDDEAGLGGATKPSIAVAAGEAFAVWRHSDGELWLASLGPR